MTREQAAKRWCPFSRISEEGSHTSINRYWTDDTLLRGTNCLGPGCMAWQWEIDGRGRVSSESGDCGLKTRPNFGDR